MFAISSGSMSRCSSEFGRCSATNRRCASSQGRSSPTMSATKSSTPGVWVGPAITVLTVMPVPATVFA